MPQVPTIDCNKIDCGESLLSNYSSEGAEPYPPYWAVVYPPLNPPPIDEEWSMPGCLYLCRSFISQEDANLCALRQSILCENPEEIWYSAPASCTATCPDGSEFVYTVAAGMFIAKTYAEALSQAQAYACLQANQQRICLGELSRCACKGQVYSDSITLPEPDLVFSLVGFLPPGLDFIATENSAVITGVPTVNGTYAFQIIATDANGNYAVKTFTIQVIEITTAALSGFTIGTPYSFQLQAAGGSGNYAWTILSGTLPPGLSLSLSGLISGTPTGAGGGSIVFAVSDTTCEAVTRTFFPPVVSMVTSATTVLRTKRGYPKFTNPDTTLYKTATWTGYVTQTAFTVGNYIPPDAQPGYDPTTPVQCAGAKYIFSDASRIDANGNFVSHHRKDLYVECVRASVGLYPPVAEGAGAEIEVLAPGLFPNSVSRIRNLLGYCWTPDGGSCQVCDSAEASWPLFGNLAIDSQTDGPATMLVNPDGYTTTALSRVYASSASGRFAIADVAAFPFQPGAISLFVDIYATGDYSVILSNPYTEEEAIATQQTFTSTMAISENLPDYLSAAGQKFLRLIYSRFTTVYFVLNFSNLVEGQFYVASYTLKDGSTEVIVNETFLATGTTHQITGTLPTPVAGHSIKIQKPTVRFA